MPIRYMRGYRRKVMHDLDRVRVRRNLRWGWHRLCHLRPVNNSRQILRRSSNGNTGNRNDSNRCSVRAAASGQHDPHYACSDTDY